MSKRVLVVDNYDSFAYNLVQYLGELGAELDVVARAPDGEVMGVRHREHETHGVQFHPESVLTPKGKALLSNFLTD